MALHEMVWVEKFVDQPELWAAPELRRNTPEEKNWSTSLRPMSSRALEWYFECNFLGYQTLQRVAEINPRRRGGVPVLRHTRFTLSQILAELANTSGVQEIADNYDLDGAAIKEVLVGLSLILLQPMHK
jgi:uncharacterized protein (DUF433 family)